MIDKTSTQPRLRFCDPCATYGNSAHSFIKKRIEYFRDHGKSVFEATISALNEVWLFDWSKRDLRVASRIYQAKYGALPHIVCIECEKDSSGYPSDVDRYIDQIERLIDSMPKFDFLVQNPPYKGSYHLKFLEGGMDLLADDGHQVVIEPATWLINLRDNGKAPMYAELRKKLDKHAISVKIENLNHEFNIGNATPLAITTLSKAARPEGQKIEFTCCGETSYVDTLDDCNLIGPRKMVSQILEKVRQRALKHMEDVVYDKDRDGSPEGAAYLKFTDVMVKTVFMLKLSGDTYDPEAIKKNAYFEHDEEYDAWYLQSVFEVGAYKGSVPTRDVPKKVATGGSKGGDAFCLMVSAYPDFESNARILENWKHFIYNSNLAHFICISTTYDLHNGSKRWLPWLDWTKKWTDDELREWFGITDSEWSLIESTCKKFRRDSEWFKRYMCGPSVSEVRQ